MCELPVDMDFKSELEETEKFCFCPTTKVVPYQFEQLDRKICM